MKTLHFVLLILSIPAFSQNDGFQYGQITQQDFQIQFEQDTSAACLVLNEFGEAHISTENGKLLFEYHVKYRVLKPEGLKIANYEIPLYKGERDKEILISLKASSYNFENGYPMETSLAYKDIFTRNEDKYWDVKAFAIPNVKVGSIVEVLYTLESPYIYKFRGWEFQGEYPKIASEYWALIPANYNYNVALKGSLPLAVNDTKLVRDCFTIGANRADCTLLKLRMLNIPAFVEEEFMTAKSNFSSSVNFELSEIRYFDGRVDRITIGWKDVGDELRKESRFGGQLRRGKDILDKHLDLMLNEKHDDLAKAQQIYNFIKDWYTWDGKYSKYSELGIKKAFDLKKGNVADINLSLVAALRYAGINADPVILSTRNNGAPIELYPVLSDYNYVIAGVEVNGTRFLLDATDKFRPFGLLPLRCLNGKGRLFSEKESSFVDLVSNARDKNTTIADLELLPDGTMKGKISIVRASASAAMQRQKLATFASHDEYFQALRKQWDRIQVDNYVIENVDDINENLRETFEIYSENDQTSNTGLLLFNPFLIGSWKKNPFKSKTRTYPVDFGYPIDETLIISITIPEKIKLDNLPVPVRLSMPDGGGRLLFDATQVGNKVNLSYNLVLSKNVYSPQEYHYLKELFDRIVHLHQTDLVFTKQP
ncbi:MAG TPA: DUF3858 domain-containing protein [Chryseosolibacter sp.]|nr:DUF3858 domain-containing protein [Chryseosolibacter sp.]